MSAQRLAKRPAVNGKTKWVATEVVPCTSQEEEFFCHQLTSIENIVASSKGKTISDCARGELYHNLLCV